MNETPRQELTRLLWTPVGLLAMGVFRVYYAARVALSRGRWS